MTTIMCTSSPSFIVPVTECYFQLTPLKEGIMLGAFYLGQFIKPTIRRNNANCHNFAYIRRNMLQTSPFKNNYSFDIPKRLYNEKN